MNLPKPLSQSPTFVALLSNLANLTPELARWALGGDERGAEIDRVLRDIARDLQQAAA